MTAQSIEFTRRQVGRVKVTAQEAMAAPAGEQLALRVLAPDMIAECDAFSAADQAVQAAEHAAEKEVAEGTAALGSLRRLFDQLREVSAAKVNITYEAASAFHTPDDFLRAAEDLENTFERADPEWAASVLTEYSPAIEAASKEYGEGSDALDALQKATLQREQAEGKLRPVLVRFRRAVRATFGSRSRQYREILDRRARKGAPEDPADET